MVSLKNTTVQPKIWPHPQNEAATSILLTEFDDADRVDSMCLEQQPDGTYDLIVNANKGNVGSGTCEFVWKL
jgi:hypothetical protein